LPTFNNLLSELQRLEKRKKIKKISDAMSCSFFLCFLCMTHGASNIIMPQVVIPHNYPEYTTRRVHVAQWIDGEKLSQSISGDVGSLVNLGVLVYLTQLLDTGFFHGACIMVQEYEEEEKSE